MSATTTVTVGSVVTGAVEFSTNGLDGRSFTGEVCWIDFTDRQSVRVVTSTGTSMFLRLPKPRRAARAR